MPQRGIGHQGDQGAFQFAEVGLHARRQEGKDVFADADTLPLGAGTEHLQPGVIVRFGKFYRQAPFEAGQEPFFEVLQVYGGAVAGENELLPVLVQVVEHVEEGVLRTLAYHVLDIVHD